MEGLKLKKLFKLNKNHNIYGKGDDGINTPESILESEISNDIDIEIESIDEINEINEIKEVCQTEDDLSLLTDSSQNFATNSECNVQKILTNV